MKIWDRKHNTENEFFRTGLLQLGTLPTPIFMPCATKGTIKGLTHAQIRDIGIKLFLCNTYHMMLRPGEEIVASEGGLHKFINWDGVILTDSGGFQIFSLGKLNKISDQGVEFSSYLDGSKRYITPAKAMGIQYKLGANIIMAFDECAPGDSSHTYAKKAMERTHKWVIECMRECEALNKSFAHNPALFPIAQGVVYKDLRIESVKFMADLPLPGIAIGGLSVGESKKQMYEILETIAPYLPKDKPRYLMGVGSPEDIVEGVYFGIDMFDCVLPTRLARHGAYWTDEGRHHILNAKNKTIIQPLMEGCTCYTCTSHSKAYLHHLSLQNEMTGASLLTIHNLHYLNTLMKRIREAIENGTYSSFREDFKKRWHATSLEESEVD